MRTFKFADDKSYKFWEIDLQGARFTVRFGRQGTAGQTQEKSFPTEAAALKEHDKLVAEKLKKGYKETTPAAKPAASSLRESLEASLVENPADLASHMAYADYLAEQGDPRGEFVQVQLALEEEGRPKPERDALKKREASLLQANAEAWLGGLSPLVKTRDKAKGWGSDHMPSEFSFARGWLHTLKVGGFTLEFVRALAREPQARLLHSLTLHNNDFEHGDPEPEDGVPEDSEHPVLYPLIRSPYLTNVKRLSLGEPMTPEAEDDAEDGGFSSDTQAEGASGVVKAMPKLEELYILAQNVDADELFSLRTLDNLRVLLYYHGNHYPLGRLAKNPSLGNLTHLLLHPHALEDEEAFIREPAVKALVTSPHLKSLTHLRLRLSDMGDKGVKTIIDSGILRRLKVLDLRHGCVSDKGASLLAACTDARNLTLLDLKHNCLTDAGVAELTSAGVKVAAGSQWRPTGDEYRDREYLYAGDIE